MAKPNPFAGKGQSKIVSSKGKWLIINSFGKVVGSFPTFRDAIVARAKASKK